MPETTKTPRAPRTPTTPAGTKTVSVSLAPDLYAKFEKLAADDDRTLSSYLSRELAGKNAARADAQ